MVWFSDLSSYFSCLVLAHSSAKCSCGPSPFDTGFTSLPPPRLTNVATNELLELQSLMALVTLDPDRADTRVLRSTGKLNFPRQGTITFFLLNPTQMALFPNQSGGAIPPQKCKFFLWLLHKQRLSTNSRLHHCHMHPTGQCPFCNAQHAPNRALPNRSIRFLCPRSDSFWSFTDLQPGSLKQPMVVDQIWTENPIEEPCPRIRSTVITCILWSIWKCRNAKIFRHEDETNLTISRRCRDDLTL